MAKYLFFTDAHAKGKNPSSRTDDYWKSWMIKFRELLSIAKKNKVEAVLCGGDLLDIPIVADSIVDDILDAIEQTGIPFYTCWGNHDQIGHNKETSKGTSLAHMFRRSKIFLEASEHQDDYAIIKFIDYDHNVEQKLKDSGLTVKESADKWKIAIVHAFITPKPFIKEVMHVVADEIKTNADLVLVGHYHEPWEKKVGNITYLDIGAFGRTSIREANIEPSVLLIDSKKRSYEIIKLKSAKPGAEVFDLTKKEHNEDIDNDLETFISNLKDLKMQTLDLAGMVEQVGKENNVDRAIIDIIITKLGEIK